MDNSPSSISVINKITLDNIPLGILKKSLIHGIGLFSIKNICKGERLCILSGQLLTLSQHKEIQRVYTLNNEQLKAYFFMEYNHVSETLVLARPLRTKYSYINHSRSPSLTLDNNDFSIRALRNISINEEFTLDYRKEPLPRAYLLGHGATYL